MHHKLRWACAPPDGFGISGLVIVISCLGKTPVAEKMLKISATHSSAMSDNHPICRGCMPSTPYAVWREKVAAAALISSTVHLGASVAHPPFGHRVLH